MHFLFFANLSTVSELLDLRMSTSKAREGVRGWGEGGEKGMGHGGDMRHWF